MLFLVTITLGCLLLPASSWKCGGPRDHIASGPMNRRNLLTRSSTLAPIRITPYYLDFSLSTTEKTKYFTDVIMPYAINFMKSRIKVYQVNEAIFPTYSYCNIFFFPGDHLRYGVKNTDLLIYIKSEYSIDDDTVAYAGTCEYDYSSRGNPIIGIMMINDYYTESYGFEELFLVAIHNIFHILGFSNNLYSKWTDENGKKYSNPTETRTIRGKTKTVLTTPNVVAKAREAFGCSTLTGVELEDYGGNGVADSHWEKRIMYNDFMISHVIDDPIYSTISLALLKDTGWYEVDYSKADVPLFGKDLSCSYFEINCLIIYYYYTSDLFCDTYGSKSCDVFSLHKSVCNSDSYGDYCYYSKPYSNGNCRNSDPSKTYKSYGAYEVIGPNSHCFIASLSEFYFASEDTRCYEVTKCTETGATVKIGTKELTCPFTGGTFSVEGFYGTITCPASKILCTGFPCLEGCRGLGKCVDGVCVCDEGYSGYACQFKCDTNCKTCNSTACVECLDSNAQPKGFICECKQGYVKSTSVCVKCSELCLNCDINSKCLACTSGSYLSGNNCFCSSGYVKSGSECVACPSNCATCSSLSLCTSCKDYFYISANGLCERCSSNCNKCSISGCSSCDPDYLLKNNLCVIICPNSCENCQSKDVCTKCSIKYYLSSGKCYPCISNCDECLNSVQCVKCSAGYILTPSNSCGLTCSSNCKTCDYSRGVCLECFSGYYLDSNKNCNQCGDNCETCTSASVCLTCRADFVLSKGICKVKCPDNCITCVNPSYCTECQSGFSLVNSICVKCSENCINCISQSICKSCASGYTLITDKCQVVCPSNCMSCSSSTVCNKCKPGYNLIDGSCKVQCPDNCMICNDDRKCTQCSDKYFLKVGVCSKCSTGCSTCSNSSECTKCDNKYYLSGTKCLACSDTNCSKCTKSACSECISGYTLKSGKCKKTRR